MLDCHKFSLGKDFLGKLHDANKTSNTNRKVSIIVSGAIRKSNDYSPSPARLLAVGHDGILIAIVVSDLDSSSSSSSSRCPPSIHPRHRLHPCSATYLVIESESIFIYEDWRVGLGEIVRSIKLIDSSNTSFDASVIGIVVLAWVCFAMCRENVILPRDD